MNYYSVQEVAKHNTEDDCWIIANDNVYDVTLFLSLHPVGKDSIVKNAGTDQSDSYNYHSVVAKALWKHYKIGKVDNIGKADECCCIIS